jgi:hypothetical protein
MMRKGVASLVLLAGLLVCQAQAYGPEGHATVGAIADLRLAGKPVATKIGNLLDGLTLAEAALLPDKIKDWDRKGPDDPDTYHLPDHPSIEKQLAAFWKANPPTAHDPNALPPNHHWFHYTDVPVAAQVTYGSGKTGRSRWDVVHMIPYCANVLRGKEPEDNERKITKPIALILLAHYVGDIHQPLHVGAQYFDENGKPVNPDVSGPAFADEGGNGLLLILQTAGDHGHPHATHKLHGYWDDDAVVTAFDLVRKEIRADRSASTGQISDGDIARRLAAREPAGWKLPAAVGVEDWSVKWADEILPVAREAHERLEFTHIRLNQTQKTATGQAIEKAQPGGTSYQDWAGQVVRDEIHKAGWRLATLLESVVD